MKLRQIIGFIMLLLSPLLAQPMVAESGEAQGGVNVKEVNPATMESKLVKNVYFAGEVLDLDAVTGGFNLQIAWSTGNAAGSCASLE